jgi:hypothetical protein
LLSKKNIALIGRQYFLESRFPKKNCTYRATIFFGKSLSKKSIALIGRRYFLESHFPKKNVLIINQF